MSTDTQPAIEAQDVYRTFTLAEKRLSILKGVDLSVSAGEKVFLVGPSGAGKTSLLYTLAGLEQPDQGRVMIRGQDLYAQPSKQQARIRNQQLGYVFQSFFLLPELSAIENVLVPTLIRGRRSRERAEMLLEKVGLIDRMNHLPAELSGGEQQRVAIARALLNEPSILFADEPTGNLDSNTGGEVIDLLLGVVEEEEKTLVVVTHDQRLAERGDRKVELIDGKLGASPAQ